MAQPPLLTLSDIALTFGGDPLFNGASLIVQPADRVCLVGRNGSGKSTLMKIMAGLVEADSGERFMRPGMNVSYMDQDPDFTGYATLGDFAMEGLEFGMEWKVYAAAEGLKLALERDPAQASGGERRRAALAKLLAAEPDLMLLDEPTNHLDIQAIAWLEEHLKQTRSAFVMISHDRTFLRELTQATLWVDRGVVRRQERGFEGFEDWRDKTFEEEDLQRHKLNRLIKDEARWAVEGISGRRKRNQGRVRRLGELRDERSSQIRRQGTAAMGFMAGSKSGRLVVEATDISKTYEDTVIVNDFSIRVMRGERLALVGPNGAGKTSLLKLLIGEENPDTGTVKIGTGLNPVVFDQNRAALDLNASLWESLAGDPLLGVSGRSDQVMVRGTPRHVVGYLKDFLFDDQQVRSPVKALSGGEKARLLLAKLMARESNLLILDEPTNDLDVETLDLLQELVTDYDGTVILVSHDRDFLDRVATTTILMQGQGRTQVYAGGWSDLEAQGAKFGENAEAAIGLQSASSTAAQKKTQELPKAAPVAANPVKVAALEAEMEKLQAEIAKLESFLADPDLYAKSPAKFDKATAGLVERQEKLAKVEEEWLELSEG
ncbi:ATP-binding cassette, subfamily F, uup [Monaibacterium marinum]|uniref:ATP-binding cassette, subfamily F, uup n=1 Tax=Pontivivens marinum TaxID=1690039 RepID=A0A2C9CQU2_9RHOB|nr:ATP-binding cassette domain-containing protein [Monaibacterium marinum]SOH93622.1 ATP-binding cassette, subfamily F, uup [Monaibacterium marinum]